MTRLHSRDTARNVHGDLHPTLCGLRVARAWLEKVKGAPTCPDCKRELRKPSDTNP